MYTLCVNQLLSVLFLSRVIRDKIDVYTTTVQNLLSKARSQQLAPEVRLLSPWHLTGGHVSHACGLQCIKGNTCSV